MSPLKSTFGAASAFGWIPRATFTPLTNVEFTVWAGGSNSGPGGQVVKKTAQTLSVPTAYTVEVGAANSLSQIYATGFSAVQATVSSTSSGNVVNGTTTTYSTFGANQFAASNYYPSHSSGGAIYLYDNITAGGGSPGANGDGGAGSINLYNSFWQGGNGGSGFSSVTGAGLSGFPSNVGGGGSAKNVTTAAGIYYYAYGYTGYEPGFSGSPSVAAPNTGTGSGGFAGWYSSGYAAASGGFAMRYSDSQKALTSTTGSVVYLQSGGYHNYFWQSTGSFTV